MLGRGPHDPPRDLMLRVGSLCAGIGGLDLAIEARSPARVVWQADLVMEQVRARHWPEATQLVGDIREMALDAFEKVDVLAAGFPCQGLSQAGTGKGLEDHRSSLFYRVVEIAAHLRPDEVILENVPRLLSRHRDEVERCLGAIGYGCTWIPVAACEAGAPHRRRRVFVVARRGAGHRVLRTTRIPRAFVAWPTATAGDAKASGSRSLSSSRAHSGTSLTDAVRPDRTTATGAAIAPGSEIAGVLNPRWVSSLMGFPTRWLDDAEHSLDRVALALTRLPSWPAPRVHGLDGASPQHEWEPPRLLPKTRRYPGRAARLRALGNAVCPPQGYLALQRADEQDDTPTLF